MYRVLSILDFIIVGISYFEFTRLSFSPMVGGSFFHVPPNSIHICFTFAAALGSPVWQSPVELSVAIPPDRILLSAMHLFRPYAGTSSCRFVTPISTPHVD